MEESVKPRSARFLHSVSTVTAPTIRILGIDPGLRSGGAAYIELADGERLIAALSLVETEKQRKEAASRAKAIKEENKGWGDATYIAVSLRARRWIDDFAAFFNEIREEFGAPELIAVESFVDQAQHAKKMMARRYQTPHVMGLLEAFLFDQGYSIDYRNLIYQDAGTVIPQLSSEIAALEERDRSKMKTFAVLPGDELITNDHKRKALAHALAASFRVRRGELPLPTPTI